MQPYQTLLGSAGKLLEGVMLDSVTTVLQWASQINRKSVAPTVHLVEITYQKGVKGLSDELEQFNPVWQRSESLLKWDITIMPN